MPFCQPSSGSQGWKRDRRSLMAAGKNTFFVKDHNSGNLFLVDTGAEVSVLPATSWDRQGHKGKSLKAANQSPIHTYGRRNVMLKFGDRRFEKEFIIADVPNRMLGMDFFEENALSIDAEKKELFTRADNITICAVATNNSPASNKQVAAGVLPDGADILLEAPGH